MTSAFRLHSRGQRKMALLGSALCVSLADTERGPVVAGALGGVGVGTLLMGAMLGTGSAFIFLRKTSRR